MASRTSVRSSSRSARSPSRSHRDSSRGRGSRGRGPSLRISPALRGTLALAGVFALLISINLYIFYFKGGTSLRALLQTTQIHANGEGPRTPPPPPRASKSTAGSAPGKAAAATGGALAAASPPQELVAQLPDDGRIAEETVAAGEGIGAALKREGVPARTSAEVTTALGHVFDLRAVRAGHTLTLRWDGEDRLRAVEYRVSPAVRYRVERRGEAWRAQKEAARVDTRLAMVKGTVESGLFDAVEKLGEQPALAMRLVDVLAAEIDPWLDVQRGDRFRLVVEKQFVAGSFYRYGRVLAVEWIGKAGTLRAYYDQPAGAAATGGYFDERGQSVEKSLLKTPLAFARVAPSVDRRRFAPTLREERAHVGLDYAAPLGTPVWATAAGRVTFRGPRGSSGNTVEIAHPGGMSTVYAHLARFPRGLAVGDLVRQKQVIGYVGASGQAVEPHLHFSVLMSGHFVDPLRLKPARGPSVAPAEKEPFARRVAELKEALAGGEGAVAAPSPSP